MLVYKFRITLEENDSYLREIEIKPGQTFLDFHNALLDCSALTMGEMASFFICDIKWRKHQEITLIKNEENENRNRGDKPPVKLMSETPLNHCIDNPNEQLIYIYDSQKLFTFYIELFKIYNSEEKVTFPRCVKKVSDVPKTLTFIPSPEAIPLEEDEEESVPEFDEKFDDGEIDEDESLMLDDIFEETNPNENN
jgi:hypothetical protein